MAIRPRGYPVGMIPDG